MTQVPASGGRFQLRLFVTGATLRSRRAIADTRTLCAAYSDDDYDLEIIDVYQNPKATFDLQVIATPTLVKVLPAPPRRVIGDLSNAARVAASLLLPESPNFAGDP